MHRSVAAALVVLCAWSGALGAARAETRVEVIATDPPGESITLGANQNLYLRLGYTTDAPVRIWVKPYFRGEEVPAGTSPSGTYSGSGEALGWFFLMKAGAEVDEIRIRAGDGTRNGTRVVATHRVRVLGGAQPTAATDAPEWVVEMKRQNEAAAREARASAASTPPSSGEMVFFAGFMIAVLCLGLFGLAAPALGVWRWRGGWRIAAAVPIALIAFVVLRIAFDTARDPTSHNLWPFEILQAGAASLVAMATLLVARKLARR